MSIRESAKYMLLSSYNINIGKEDILFFGKSLYLFLSNYNKADKIKKNLKKILTEINKDVNIILLQIIL